MKIDILKNNVSVLTKIKQLHKIICVFLLQEMQLLLLKYREEIIQSKVAKEHTEETLKSEIMFLKDQIHAEQQEKNNIEESLSQELATVQEKLGN